MDENPYAEQQSPNRQAGNNKQVRFPPVANNKTNRTLSNAGRSISVQR